MKLYIDFMEGKGKWERMPLNTFQELSPDYECHHTWQIYTDNDLGELSPCFGDLIFDLDDAIKIENAHGEAIQVVKDLLFMGIFSENIKINFSGGKGFHIRIDYHSFLDKPFLNLHLIYKQIYNALKIKYPTLDKNIYCSRHMIRVVNTPHHSGLFAIPLTIEELNFSIDKIKSMAKQKREFTSPKSIPDLKMRELFQKALNKQYLSEESFSKALVKTMSFAGQMPPCIEKILTLTGLTGDRNQYVYYITRALKGIKTEDEIRGFIDIFCKNNDYPTKEAFTTMESAFTREGSFLSCGLFESLGFCNKDFCDSLCKINSGELKQKVEDKFIIHEVDKLLQLIKKRFHEGDFKRVLKTGIASIDNKTAILKDSIIVIGANSNFGKTSLAISIVKNNPDKKFLYLGIEEGPERTALRLNRARYLKGPTQIIEGKIGEITADDIEALLQYSKPDCLIIDQLINLNNVIKQETERLKYKKMMERLRGISRELSIPIFILHQLNRDAVFSDEPFKEQLAEGADVERLAYDVWLLYRKKYNGEYVSLLKIAKNKAYYDNLIFPLEYDVKTNTYLDYGYDLDPEMAKELKISVNEYNDTRIEFLLNFEE